MKPAERMSGLKPLLVLAMLLGAMFAVKALVQLSGQLVKPGS